MDWLAKTRRKGLLGFFALFMVFVGFTRLGTRIVFGPTGPTTTTTAVFLSTDDPLDVRLRGYLPDDPGPVRLAAGRVASGWTETIDLGQARSTNTTDPCGDADELPALHTRTWTTGGHGDDHAAVTVKVVDLQTERSARATDAGRRTDAWISCIVREYGPVDLERGTRGARDPGKLLE